jgi:hypothetical protein
LFLLIALSEYNKTRRTSCAQRRNTITNSF